MIQKNITIPKTARYFILGEVSEQIEQIWFVCHGYGQLANYFIKKFEVLNTGKNLIVAPEALHRFYWKDFDGKVGASWMTKVERLEEISDYINYLDTVYTEILLPFKNKKVKINVLGFSQGTAAICRWLANKKPDISNLILWAGTFPHDLNFEKDKEYFNKIKSYLFFGTEDEFYTSEEIETHKKIMIEKGFNFELILFKGKHEIPEETLLQLVDSLKVT